MCRKNTAQFKMVGRETTEQTKVFLGGRKLNLFLIFCLRGRAALQIFCGVNFLGQRVAVNRGDQSSWSVLPETRLFRPQSGRITSGSGISKIALCSKHQNWNIGSKMLDFCDPFFLDVVVRVEGVDWKADEKNVRLKGGLWHFGRNIFV